MEVRASQSMLVDGESWCGLRDGSVIGRRLDRQPYEKLSSTSSVACGADHTCSTIWFVWIQDEAAAKRNREDME